MYAIQRYHDISCGHVVSGHESKCAHLHGHNYRVHFTVVPAMIEGGKEDRMAEPYLVNGGLDKVGRVIDFSVVKSRLCQWLEDNWDHKFLVWREDIRASYLSEIDGGGVCVVPFNPTAENMAQYLVEVIGPQQLEGTNTVLRACKIDETRKCSAIYYSRSV